MLGLLHSVKTDADGIVRKVTVRYRLPKNESNHRQFKYVERNVRGLALIMTSQEKEDFQEQIVDDRRFDDVISNVSSEHDESEAEDQENSNDDQERNPDEAFEEVPSYTNDEDANEPIVNEGRKKNDDARVQLEPSSTGRKSFTPSRLNL